MVPYYIDDQSTDLGSLQARLEHTDLIPSQLPLLDGLNKRIAAFRKAGIDSVADLRAALKNSRSLASLSERSGVDSEYLKLLKRTINGFFPKPRSLGEADWLGKRTIAALHEAGIKNTQQLFEACEADRADVVRQAGVNPKDLSELNTVSGLCRIQWVSPGFARVLMAAGMKDAATIAKADPEALYAAIADANEGAKFYKGKVGLRDVRRLVTAAGYVP